jgi:hypothetical protein
MNIFKIALFACIILFVNVSFGQYDKDKPRMKGQIDSLMKIKFTAETNIDQTTADKFFDKYKENNKEIREFKNEKREIMKMIEANPAALDVGTKLDKLMKLEYDIFESRKAFVEDLKTFMTPQQIAETMVFMKEFSKKFRKKLKQDKRKNDDR